MNRIHVFVTVASLGLAVACEKPVPPAPAAPSAEVPAPKPAAALPTVEDFEQEAAEQIDSTNAEKELEALEREVSADG